jgi:hypothetical protein
MAVKKQQSRSVPPGPADDVETFLATLAHDSKPAIIALRGIVRGIAPSVADVRVSRAMASDEGKLTSTRVSRCSQVRAGAESWR